MQKKALIFGVSGQDGTYLSKFLLSKGYEVHGSSRDAELSEFRNLKTVGIRDKVQIHSVAINDFRSVLQAISKVEPDEIYNLAGQTSVSLSFQQPVETLESISVGTLNILEALRFLCLQAKFYDASSSECFGNTQGKAADENTPFYPRSPYAVAKATSFWQVVNYREAYGLFACSGVLFNHESPLRPLRFVTRKIVCEACQIALGEKDRLPLGNLSVQRDWGWAPEYVKGMWMMLQQDEPEDFVLATGECHSLQAFAEAVFQMLGLDWQRCTYTDSSLYRPNDIEISVGNSAKAEEKLGWIPKYRMPDIVRMMVECEAKAMEIPEHIFPQEERTAG